MPRVLCLEYPGASYHVVNRGDRREPIFRRSRRREAADFRPPSPYP